MSAYNKYILWIVFFHEIYTNNEINQGQPPATINVRPLQGARLLKSTPTTPHDHNTETKKQSDSLNSCLLYVYTSPHSRSRPEPGSIVSSQRLVIHHGIHWHKNSPKRHQTENKMSSGNTKWKYWPPPSEANEQTGPSTAVHRHSTAATCPK